jgi:hypothetical protein
MTDTTCRSFEFVGNPVSQCRMRNNNQLTNPTRLTAIREPAVNSEIQGITAPVGSMIMINSYPMGMNPTLLNDHEDFRPERWLPDAIEARKGTPAAQSDHPLSSGDFSQERGVNQVLASRRMRPSLFWHSLS